MKTTLFLLILFAIFMGFRNISHAQDFQPITPENISTVELGFAVPGHCIFGGISPDGQFLASNNFYEDNNALYKLPSGEQILTLDGKIVYDPDRQWLVVENVGVYKYMEMIKHFDLPRGSIVVDPTWQYIFVENIGVYLIESGEIIFSVDRPYAAFSPMGTYIVIPGEGVYQLDTLEFIVPYPEESWNFRYSFSPDENWIVVEHDGVYNLNDKQRYWQILSGSGPPDFSDDSKYLSLSGTGVYQVATGEQIVAGLTLGADFTNDSTKIAWSDGLYDLTTGEKIRDWSLSTVRFSPTEKFLVSEAGLFDAISGNRIDTLSPYGAFVFEDAYMITAGGIYDTNSWEVVSPILGSVPSINESNTLITSAFQFRNDLAGTGSSCLIYGAQGNNWRYRSGIVFSPEPLEAFISPNDLEPIGTVFGQMIVYATDEEKQWFKVFLDTEDNSTSAWINADYVQPSFLPDGIPQEIFD